MTRSSHQRAWVIGTWTILGAAVGGGVAWLMVDMDWIAVDESVGKSIRDFVGGLPPGLILSMMVIGAVVSLAEAAYFGFLRLSEIRSYVAWAVAGAGLATAFVLVLPVLAILGLAVAGHVGATVAGVIFGAVAYPTAFCVVAIIGGREPRNWRVHDEHGPNESRSKRLKRGVGRLPELVRLMMLCCLIPGIVLLLFLFRGGVIGSWAGGILIGAIVCWLVASVIALFRIGAARDAVRASKSSRSRDHT